MRSVEESATEDRPSSENDETGWDDFGKVTWEEFAAARRRFLERRARRERSADTSPNEPEDETRPGGGEGMGHNS